MAQTVIARMPLLNRLRNSYDKTVNIAPLGSISLLERCLNTASGNYPPYLSMTSNKTPIPRILTGDRVADRLNSAVPRLHGPTG